MDINYLHKLMALELLPPLPLLRRAGRRHRRVLIDDTSRARANNLTRLA